MIICSQAGGGLMGIGPASYLEKIEWKLGKSSFDLYDVFCGTSIGSVNSAFLAIGNSASDLVEIELSRMPAWFSERTFRSRFGGCPKYKDSKIMKDLDYYFGNKTFRDAKKPLYLTAYDARKKDIKVFGMEDTNIKIKDAIRASVAAPTYFSPVWNRYVDGGLAANNPLLCGLAGIIKDGLNQPGEDLKLFNLVTSGKNPEIGKLDNTGNAVKTLKSVLIPAITAGNASDTEFIAKAWLKSLGQDANLFTVQPNCPDYEMDDRSIIRPVKAIWESQFYKDFPKLNLFLT